MTGEIAVGVPMFSRVGALRQLLESVPEYVQTVYVADNGLDQDRRLYRESWPFDLDVLHLDHDIGIGACRAAITDAVDEPYLWMGDNDMEFVRGDDLRQLRSILEAHDDLGGVAGWLVEDGTVRSGARNLRVTDSTAVVGRGSDPDIVNDPLPHAAFEYLPQAALFRTAVFDTYDYDPSRRNDEHTDFFLGQRDAGEWTFASTPAVQVRHNKNQRPEYRERRAEQHQTDDGMAAKWGLDRRVPGSPPRWDGRSVPEGAFGLFRSATPPRVWLPARRVLNRVVG